MAIWFTNNIFLLTLPLLSDLENTARLKAFLNILLPFQQVVVGLSLLALPVFAREFTEKSRTRATSLSRWSFLASGLGSLVYSALILLGGNAAYAVIYGSKYVEGDNLIRYGLMLPILWAAIAVCRTILRAKRMPKTIFMSYAWALATIGVVAVPLGSAFGAKGALLGMTLVQIAITLFMVGYLRRSSRLDEI